jgi:hypothetical protein
MNPETRLTGSFPFLHAQVSRYPQRPAIAGAYTLQSYRGLSLTDRPCSCII